MNSNWMILLIQYVTLDHKNNFCQFFLIEMHALFESWINYISINVWFVMIWQYLESENAKKNNL